MKRFLEATQTVGCILLVSALVFFGIPAMLYFDQNLTTYHTLDDVPENASSSHTETLTITNKALSKSSHKESIHRFYYIDESGNDGYIDVDSRDFALHTIGDEIQYSTYHIAGNYWDNVRFILFGVTLVLVPTLVCTVVIIVKNRVRQTNTH